MNEKQIFDVVLEKHENMDATGITIPFDVEKVFGAKRVPVKIKINDADYRTTIFRMGGEYKLAIPKEFRDRAGIKAGDTVTVEITKDNEERIVELPGDLSFALSENPSAKEIWERLSYTHKKEYVRAIEDAKKVETRRRRVQKTIDDLLKKKN